eukprot:201276_1
MIYIHPNEFHTKIMCWMIVAIFILLRLIQLGISCNIMHSTQNKCSLLHWVFILILLPLFMWVTIISFGIMNKDNVPLNERKGIFFFPTPSPTNSPTLTPTTSPTAAPSLSPTQPPTFFPTLSPTLSPTFSRPTLDNCRQYENEGYSPQKFSFDMYAERNHKYKYDAKMYSISDPENVLFETSGSVDEFSFVNKATKLYGRTTNCLKNGCYYFEITLGYTVVSYTMKCVEYDYFSVKTSRRKYIHVGRNSDQKLTAKICVNSTNCSIESNSQRNKFAFMLCVTTFIQIILTFLHV